MADLVNDGVPRKSKGWQVEPFSDMSATFLFSSSPVRICVLDRLSWWIYELSDGRTEEEIAAHVVEGTGGRFTDPAEALSLVRARLGSLRTSELIA
jgi:hypothetical protein